MWGLFMEDTWAQSCSEGRGLPYKSQRWYGYLGVGGGLTALYSMCMCVDEELGGDKGMGAFIETPFFKAMNVGFALDEGGQ